MINNIRERTQSEKLFYNLVPGSVWSSDEQDMKDHIDIITPDFTVDVKGMKKINRDDITVTPDIHWVEFRNVNGDVGWIYGKASYIAFERVDDYLLVDREVLLQFCKEKITDRKIKNKKQIYKLYSRPGRQDVISLILTKDLLELSNIFLINKNQ